MSTVFLYAGQGSQKVGMGKDFYDNYETYRDFVDSVKLDFDFKELMFNGPLEKLSQTEYTQGCMAVHAAGVTKLLLENGIKPDAACGLSLGEYGALYAAGVFDADTYVNITAFRGRVMMEAAKGCQCSMSAILGLKPDVVKEESDACSNGFVTVANYNCPGQYVICGDENAVTDTEERLKARGAKRCVRLNVSGPFHTKYMEPAGAALREYLEKTELNKPQIPVALNVTGSLYNGENLVDNLEKQVCNSVQLESDLRALINAGGDRFIEIGPGNAVSGFLRKTAKAMGVEVSVASIDSVEDFKKLIG